MRSPRTRFEQLALPHLDAAHTLAFWLVRDRADSQDVVQDAYVRALRAFGGFRGEDIKPWLLTIVRNVAYRLLATRQRANNVVPIADAFTPRDHEADSVIAIPSPEPSVEMTLIDLQQQARVRQALDQLSPIFREVLVLREVEGLSYADIATIMGVPQGTVMSRLSRARALLRERFQDLSREENRNAL